MCMYVFDPGFVVCMYVFDPGFVVCMYVFDPGFVAICPISPRVQIEGALYVPTRI